MAQPITSGQEKQFVCFVADAAESAAKTAVAQVKSSPCVSARNSATAGGTSTTGGSARVAAGVLAVGSLPRQRGALTLQSTSAKDPWSSWSTKGF